MSTFDRLPTAPYSRLAYFPVTCRAGSSLLRGRTRRALSAEEVTKTCEFLLAIARRRRCPYWLLDGRESLLTQPLELHEWLQADYFPRVRVQLGQPPCIALLVAPDLCSDLQQPGYEATITEWPAWGARVGWFTEESTALAWLRRQEAHARERHQQLAPSAPRMGPAAAGGQLRFNF